MRRGRAVEIVLRRYGGRLALAAAVLVPIYGLLRVFAGLLHLFLPDDVLARIPEIVSDVHNHQAIITGAILFVFGVGLLKRTRATHAIICVVLAGTFVSGVAIGVTTWFWGSALTLLVVLLLLAPEFSEPGERSFRPAQAVALAIALLTVGYGIIGAYLLRDQFENLNSWEDALYFAVTTLTTLGYGDIVPTAGGRSAKFFSVSLVILGISTFFTALSLLFMPMMEAQLKGVIKAMDRFRNRSLANHVIVCYYTQVGASAVDELREKGQHVVVIEPDERVASVLRSIGSEVLEGNPTDEATLRRANLDTARAIIGCSDEDADNAMIALIANEERQSGRNPGLLIVTRVEQETGLTKMRSAGADHAVSPSTLGGRMLGKLASGETPEGFGSERVRVFF